MAIHCKRFVRRFVGALGALAWILAAPAAGADADGKTKVKAAFENTGVQPAAEGKIEFKAKPGQSELELEFEDLDPTKTYTLSCDGTTWATFQAGEAELHFASSPSPGEPMLPVDPRGASFALSDGTQDILTVVLSGPGEPAGTKASDKGSLDDDGLPPGASTKTSFANNGKGKKVWAVSGGKLPAGPYKLMVDGEDEAEFEIEKQGGKFKLRFADPQKGRKDLPLDFDPRDSLVELEGPGGLMASSDGSPSISGLDACTESEVEAPLAAVGGVGEGKSELKIDHDCDKSFEVEIEDIPEGVYEVFVDGVLRGTIVAAFNAARGRVEGEREWETDPDDPGELLLNFDPEGALVEVRQGATVFFSGVQTPPLPGAPGGGPCTESETQVALVSTGAIAGAKGKADLDVDDDCDESFEVEIEDVPERTYSVHVGGIPRGTIDAVFNPAKGEVEGQVEWDTDPDDPGELLLDFDPRGQLIEVFDGGTKILERTFPS
jgi:hypothetical protein